MHVFISLPYIEGQKMERVTRVLVDVCHRHSTSLTSWNPFRLLDEIVISNTVI